MTSDVLIIPTETECWTASLERGSKLHADGDALVSIGVRRQEGRVPRLL